MDGSNILNTRPTLSLQSQLVCCTYSKILDTHIDIIKKFDSCQLNILLNMNIKIEKMCFGKTTPLLSTVESPYNYVLILVTSATLSPLLFYPRRLEFLAPFYTMWPRIDDKIIMKPGCLLDWLSIDMIALQVIHTIWSYSSWILQPKLENLKKITGSAQMRFCDVPS